MVLYFKEPNLTENRQKSFPQEGGLDWSFGRYIVK